eukprot:scaffold47211_cov34-Tisochrysis_lutea.AAC.1
MCPGSWLLQPAETLHSLTDCYAPLQTESYLLNNTHTIACAHTCRQGTPEGCYGSMHGNCLHSKVSDMKEISIYLWGLKPAQALATQLHDFQPLATTCNCTPCSCSHLSNVVRDTCTHEKHRHTCSNTLFLAHAHAVARLVKQVFQGSTALVRRPTATASQRGPRFWGGGTTGGRDFEPGSAAYPVSNCVFRLFEPGSAYWGGPG